MFPVGDSGCLDEWTNTIVPPGQTWFPFPEADPCFECRCEGGLPANCKYIQCLDIGKCADGSEPIKVEGECCPRCPPGDYDEPEDVRPVAPSRRGSCTHMQIEADRHLNGMLRHSAVLGDLLEEKRVIAEVDRDILILSVVCVFPTRFVGQSAIAPLPPLPSCPLLYLRTTFFLETGKERKARLRKYMKQNLLKPNKPNRKPSQQSAEQLP